MMSKEDESGMGRRTALNKTKKTNSVLQENQEPVTATRRPLLKGLSATLASVIGLGGTAAGQSSGESKFHKQVTVATEDYRSPAAVVDSVDNDAESLMDELVSRGYLNSATGSDLGIDSVAVQKSPAEVDPEAGTYLTAFEKDGQFTAHISVVRKTPSKVIRINVRPQAGESFATIKTRDGELLAVIDPDSDDVSTQELCSHEGYDCPPGSCCFNCGTLQVKHEEICCLLPSGTTDCYTEPIDQCCQPAVCC